MHERYEDAGMKMVWEPNAILRRWHEVEVANMHRIGRADLAGPLVDLGPPSWGRVHEFERETKHEVVAFLYALDDHIKVYADAGTTQQVRQYLHFGLTSSDVVDCAQVMGLRMATHRIKSLAGETLTAFARLTGDERPTIGRTHGQLAAPMEAGHRWLVLWSMMSRAIAPFDKQARQGVWYGKMSGPVGANTDHEIRGLLALDLDGTMSTQIVPRDRLAKWANEVMALVDVCEATATQAWLLCQQGINEASEDQPRGAVGSSAMPHKRNPVAAENIRGLARLARMNAQVLQLGVVQWNEHDLAHSSVERVALPDLCHLAATILTRTGALLRRLTLHPYSPTRLDDYSDTQAELLAMQRDGVPYAEAHRSLTYPGGKITADTGTGEDTA